MKPLNLAVLLFCLITYGNGRPSESEERDEIMREAKKERHFQHDNVAESPEKQTESPTTENALNRLKSIAHLRMAETKRSSSDSIGREELEALRDLLDKNLQKYRNHNEYSLRKRPNDPYISQILDDLNGDQQSVVGGNNNDKYTVERLPPNRIPIRRKIIRHTVFSTHPGGRISGDRISGVGSGNSNRVYGNDVSSRIDWATPWADYFPILIRDPFQSTVNSFSEIIEYGPAADICRRSVGDGELDGFRNTRTPVEGGDDVAVRPDALKRSRRNAASAVGGDEEKGVLNHVRPFRPHSTTTTTTELPKIFHWVPDRQAGEHNGDTGPQIKRLVVRRGGVAIAGPGGIATAGSGGTAIVGPGGSAYSSKDSASGATADVPMMLPGGVSLAGHGPHAVQGPYGYFSGYPQQYNGYGRSVDGGGGGTALLSSDGVAYTFPVPSRGLTVAARRSTETTGVVNPYAASAAKEIRLPDGAKLIATGPIVYYNPEPSTRTVTKKRSRKGKKPSLSDDPNAKKRAVNYHVSF